MDKARVAERGQTRSNTNSASKVETSVAHIHPSIQPVLLSLLPPTTNTRNLREQVVVRPKITHHPPHTQTRPRNQPINGEKRSLRYPSPTTGARQVFVSSCDCDHHLSTPNRPKTQQLARRPTPPQSATHTYNNTPSRKQATSMPRPRPSGRPAATQPSQPGRRVPLTC